MSERAKLDDEARVVFERHHACDEKYGPSEFGRIGYAIGPQVVWVDSYCYPGTENDHYRKSVEFAQAVVDRWNYGSKHLTESGK